MAAFESRICSIYQW